MSKKRLLSNTAITSVFLFGLGQAAHAADPYVPADPDLPAVSSINFKIAPYVGYQDDEWGDGGNFGLIGSVAIPLGHRFGAEIGGHIAGVDGDFFARGEGHVFWRNPSRGLVGVYGSIEGFDDVGGFDTDAWRLAVEGAAYLDRVTVDGRLGYEDMSTPQRDVDGVYAVANVHYYATDDLRLTAGVRRMYDMNMGALGVEYQLGRGFLGSGTSLFADARFGDDDYTAIWGGFRMYFGAEEKSLIRRHREDDPFFADEAARTDECSDDKSDKSDKCRGSRGPRRP